MIVISSIIVIGILSIIANAVRLGLKQRTEETKKPRIREHKDPLKRAYINAYYAHMTAHSEELESKLSG